ncbi:hypothetical protein D3C73_979890 [compost metagenome]
MFKLRSIDIVFLLISLLFGGFSSSLLDTIISSTFEMKILALCGIILVFIIALYYMLLRSYYIKIKNETIAQLGVSIFLISLLFASFLTTQIF